MSPNQTHIAIASENSYIIYFGDPDSLQISPEVSAAIASACAQVKQHFGTKLIDLVASYASLLVIYDTHQCDHLWAKTALRLILDTPQQVSQNGGQLVEIPVFYSTKYGPELNLLAQNAGLSVEQIIDIHSATEYRVYAIGFAPGFAYLGEVDERLAAPRLATPRLKVPAGAVAIADRQTAVYPASSPGGWNLIGLCPTPMFNPQTQPHMPVTVGDRVRFVPIDEQQYLTMGGLLHEL
ncbi:5-oxoprolinase subunit PxpB [Oceanospirillaceae bacterium]|nr:5-oxoprolinase subunit PxpB [Oceanospirillaceae bacterium]